MLNIKLKVNTFICSAIVRFHDMGFRYSLLFWVDMMMRIVYVAHNVMTCSCPIVVGLSLVNYTWSWEHNKL